MTANETHIHEMEIREMEKDAARGDEEIRLLRGRVRDLETALRQESERLDWLLARQYSHKTRESIDLELRGDVPDAGKGMALQ